MAKKHIKVMPNIIWEIQIKTTKRYHFTSTKIGIIINFKKAIATVGEDMEKLEYIIHC